MEATAPIGSSCCCSRGCLPLSPWGARAVARGAARNLPACLPASACLVIFVDLFELHGFFSAREVCTQVDELGTGDVPWADTTIVAPTLLRLGEEGLRLGAQYAWQWCAPTRGSLLSGRFPMHTGYTGGGMPGDGEGMELKWPLLPAELKAAGCEPIAPRFAGPIGC